MTGNETWPVLSGSDLHALSELATLFGISFDGKTPILKSEDGERRGCVAVLSHTLSAHASLYASLTGRHCIVPTSIEELVRTDNIDVLLLTFDSLDRKLLDVIWRITENGQAPGIVCAYDHKSLWRQVLLRAASLAFSRVATSAQTRWTDLFAKAEFASVELSGRKLVGKYAADADIRKALVEGAHLLRVISTSDGVDSDLGGGLILCPMDELGSKPVGPSPPYCAATGLCHRLRLERNDASAQPRLVSFHDVRAVTLLWQTCLGLTVQSRAAEDSWAIGRLLIQSPRIAATITTCDYVVTSHAITESLASRLINGDHIGTAIGRFAQESRCQTEDHRLFLFGDPELRLTASPHKGELRLTASPHKGEITPKVALSDKTLNCSLGVRPAEGVPDGINLARDIIASVSSSLPCPPPNLPAVRLPHEDAYSADIAESVLNSIIGRRWARWAEGCWSQASLIIRRHVKASCAGCDENAITYELSYDRYPAETRLLRLCRCCGVIQDVPAYSDITFRISGEGECSLNGTLPTRVQTAYAVIFSNDPSEPPRYRWPVNNGCLDHSLRLALKWPQGPIRVGVYIMGESWYALFQSFRPNVP